ncbi:MAG: SLC13/DASS family transporter [Cellvibrionales bacterium]|nr:SLC13/DASS family transporter [Cellvibrionales bacterium]
MSNKNLALLGAPLAAIALRVGLGGLGIDPAIANTLAITLLTAIWWVTEALPIPATSLVPLVGLPLVGVLDQREAAGALGSHLILLLMGGLMLAKGLEKAGLHRRLSLHALRLTGGRGGRRLVLAFMLAGAGLSMWISNTAACLVLLPIALAVIKQLDEPRTGAALILGIAFACNLGGVGTLVGTPPNLVFAGVYEEFSGAEYGFARWLGLGLPTVVLGLPLIWLWLTRGLAAGRRVELPSAGSWTIAERRALVVFGLIVLLWVLRLEPAGGWARWTGIELAGDSTVALFGVVLMFLLPDGKGGRLLDWQAASDIPWGMLLLFAGGLCIAKGFAASGTSAWLGAGLSGTATLHPLLVILAICLAVTFLTEITSNTATTSLLMPILAAGAVAAGLPMELLMVPAAMSASCAFMLPVATAPNAIAYGSGQVSVGYMARQGLVLNLLMAGVIALVCYFNLG